MLRVCFWVQFEFCVEWIMEDFDRALRPGEYFWGYMRYSFPLTSWIVCGGTCDWCVSGCFLLGDIISRFKWFVLWGWWGSLMLSGVNESFFVEWVGTGRYGLLRYELGSGIIFWPPNSAVLGLSYFLQGPSKVCGYLVGFWSGFLRLRGYYSLLNFSGSPYWQQYIWFWVVWCSVYPFCVFLVPCYFFSGIGR